MPNDKNAVGLSEEDVERAYRKILLRSADPDGLKTYTGRMVSLHQLEITLRGSKEYKDREAASIRKKVLLFGAYGNGNLGDAIQARSLLNCISAILPGIEVWATSTFPQPYSFPDSRTLPIGTIRSIDALLQFDALLIGGGGLLAHPHEPLPDVNWVKSVPIPFAFLSVGANDRCALQANVAISKAAWASGRDIETINELRKYRSQVDFMPDPLLIEDVPTHAANGANAYETCWILRGPLDKNHDFIASVLKPEDIVIGLEPTDDEPLKKVFPEMVFIENLEHFNNVVSCSRRVVSMRFHGLILSLRLHRPVYSIRMPKGTALLNMLGLGVLAVAQAQDLMFVNAKGLGAFEAQRCFFRELFRNSLLNMFATLDSAIAL